NRARADLRMGLPVVLSDAGRALLVAAAEVLTPERLADLRGLGAPVLVLTSRRAETLKARAYDGDLARIVVPGDAGVTWLRAVADPRDDLSTPMKGPFASLRDGAADLHRAGISLAKSAQLLPAVVAVTIDEGFAFAARHG